MAAGESIERAGNGNDHEGSLGKKEEWSSEAEAHNLECHEVLDLEKENLDVKIEKLERKILELRMDLERIIEAKRGRVPQKQAEAEKLAEAVDQLVELERQGQRIEAARRKLDF